jgi:hypothetical protein
MSLQHRTEPVEAGPESWSDYWDLYTWEISDPTEVAELGRLAVEAECDRHDAPDVPSNQISATELAMAAAGLALG